MIPIKKIKAEILKEFNSRSEEFDQKCRDLKNLKGHYLSIPWFGDNYLFNARWNIKQNRFDRLDFLAFGREHRIKL